MVGGDLRRQRKILVVEDDPDLRDLIATRLALVGYRVSEAEDGVHALQIVEVDRPDVVVLDIGLPALDGLSVRDEILAHEETRDIGIVFVTGVADRHGQRLGQDCVLRKPVASEDLLAAIRDALNTKA